MEQLKGLRQMESTLSLVSDHVSVLSSRLEALVFRAQRIAHAMKDGRQEPDMMFGYDLQNFRRDVRTFGNEIGGLGTTLGSISRAAQYDEESVAHAQSVMRVCDRLQRALAALRDQSQLAHQHIRQAEHKMEAWYLGQEIEALVHQNQGLHTIANKIVIVVSTKPGAPPAAPPPSAPPPDAGRRP